MEDLGRGTPAKNLAGTLVEALLDREQIRQGVDAQISALGEVLAQQAVGRSYVCQVVLWRAANSMMR
jgi:hypothetical protein